jgi:hypothetical protein
VNHYVNLNLIEVSKRIFTKSGKREKKIDNLLLIIDE